MSVIHLLRADLELTSPGGVTAPEATSIGSVLAPDLPIARDGWGAVYVPGTSVAGSLRAAAPEERAVALFGTVRPIEKADGTTGTEAIASPVRILGTRLLLPDKDGALATRRRTAINRHRGAAEEKTLHTRELLPPGTILTVWLRLDQGTNAPALHELIDVLTSWQPYIGGGRTTGYGHAALRTVRHRAVDLTTAEGLTHWLRNGGPRLIEDDAELLYDYTEHGGVAEPPPLLGRELHFRIADALHIGTGDRHERGARQTGYAAVLRDHQGLPLVPGTAWKGLLRSRVEYILRSVGLPACHSVGGDGCCGECDICTTFGWTEQQPDDDQDSVGAHGSLLFTDSVIRDGSKKIRNHVALDRVFGGARPNALYSEETIEDGELTLHIRYDGIVPQTVRAALTLALCDLADGRLGIGRGTTRGQGTLAALPGTAQWLTSERGNAQETLRQEVSA